MRRREFIAGLGGAAVWPLTVHGQPAVPVVGVLNSVSAADWKGPMSGFCYPRREVEGEAAI
jgi:hypothetical protein